MTVARFFENTFRSWSLGHFDRNHRRDRIVCGGSQEFLAVYKPSLGGMVLIHLLGWARALGSGMELTAVRGGKIKV